MDETILVYFLFQEFSEVRDVFSVGMQFCGQSEGPMGRKCQLYPQPDCLSCHESYTDVTIFTIVL